MFDLLRKNRGPRPDRPPGRTVPGRTAFARTAPGRWPGNECSPPSGVTATRLRPNSCPSCGRICWPRLAITCRWTGISPNSACTGMAMRSFSYRACGCAAGGSIAAVAFTEMGCRGKRFSHQVASPVRRFDLYRLGGLIFTVIPAKAESSGTSGLRLSPEKPESSGAALEPPAGFRRRNDGK